MDVDHQPHLPAASLLNVWTARQKLSKAFSELDLTFAQATLLTQLCELKHPDQFALVLAVSREALSLTLRQLEGKGLIAREKFQGDGRRVVVTLTPAGSETCEQIAEVVARTR